METKKALKVLANQHANRGLTQRPYTEYLSIVNSKDKVLGRFQPVFDAVDQLSETDFRDFLSFKHNCHWTGLERPTRHVCDDMDRLRSSLGVLFDEDRPITKRLNSLIAGGELAVKGLGPGIVTALLLLRFPDRYSVWNGKSQTAMKALKIWPKFERGISIGQQYEILNSLCLEIADEIDIDLWCLDGLWHVINEKSKLDADLTFEQMENDEREYLEGKKTEFTGFRIERSTKARNKCISEQGLDCAVCGFNFFEKYGELGLGFIHVHHREELALRREERTTDPVKELVPVCPNCHAMLHKRTKPCIGIEQLKQIVANQGAQ